MALSIFLCFHVIFGKFAPINPIWSRGSDPSPTIFIPTKFEGGCLRYNKKNRGFLKCICFSNQDKRNFRRGPLSEFWHHNEVWSLYLGGSQGGAEGKFMDSCGHHLSLGISNDFKLGQMLRIDEGKIWAKFYFNPTSWRISKTSNVVKLACDVTDDVINWDVVNLWRHRLPKECHKRFLWKFPHNLIIVWSFFTRNGWPVVIDDMSTHPPPRKWDLKKSPDQIGLRSSLFKSVWIKWRVIQ